MNRKYLRSYVFVMILLIISFTFIYYSLDNYTNYESQEKANAQMRIQLNEIEQRVEQESSISVHKEVESITNAIPESIEDNNFVWLVGAYAFMSILITFIFLYLYLTMVRPFHRLESFANEVAKGNLDAPLQANRMNMFGAFSWAFDNLRFELKKARENEMLAITNSKTMIATISHDIKTPIASISAYSEALEANIDTTIERRSRYLNVIQNKCKEVTDLTNDLFLHSLSDIEELKFDVVAQNLKVVCEEIFKDMKVQYGERVKLPRNIPNINVFVDKRRFVQAVENVVSNAIKYTDKSVEIIFIENEGFVSMDIQDYGSGIFEEDLPFILEKFYRGKNIEDKPGAGLGLYIVKEIMDKMDGEVLLENNDNGLLVRLKIRK